jgi:hypothetical protein
MPKRSCSVDKCCLPHRARGLCSTHYNQRIMTPATRHAARTKRCDACGTPVQRRNKTDRRPACSPECRATIQFGTTEHQHGYDWADMAARRARAAGATIIELFDRATVYERDDWTCGICNTTVTPGLDPFDPESATVDHIVPLSKGGQHTLANAQCAHLRCNSAKQDALASTTAGSHAA